MGNEEIGLLTSGRPFTGVSHDARAWVGLLAVVAACSTWREELPGEYLGRWDYIETSGGLAGLAVSDAPGYIVINADNTLLSFDASGSLLRSEEFTLTRGRTIFSTDEDQWLLGFDDPSRAELVIQVSADGRTMSISDNAYDGFVRAYRRPR